MATIDDLKKDGRKVSASIQMGEPEYSKKTTLGPIKNNNNNTAREVKLEAPNVKPRNVSASIQMGQPTYETFQAHEPTKKIERVSMTTGQEAKHSRTAANFNTLPPDKSENLGVDIKESLESDIFAKGGPFDQYVKEKTEEVKEWYAEEAAKAQAKAEEAEQAKEDAESPHIEEEEDMDTTILPATNGRIIDITKKEKKPAMKVNDQDIKEEIKAPVEEYKYGDEYEYDDLEYDIEEEEEEAEEDPEPITVPVEPGPAIVEPQPEVHNAEEIISTEPVEEPKKESSIDKIDRVTRRIMSVDLVSDVDDEDEDDNSLVETKEEDEIEILRSLISQKIVPVSKKLDISSFAIAKKATNSNNIFETKEAAIAKWVLPASGICILLREISGANLETMRTLLTRRIPDMRGVLKIIYDHIVSPKPESFEVWMKSIAFADYDHLFMAIYIAAFAEANFLPIDCAECKKPYLTEDIDIMDMVKFKDDEAKEKFTDLYNAEPVNPNGLYVTENVAISEKFAIAFREPSLYTVLIEAQYFDDKFNRKYQQAIALLPYIDNIYYIDIERRCLIPIEFKRIANDPAKTARLKVKKIDAILNSFTVDENSILSAYTDKINNRIDWFSYRIPESTCPNCKHVNPADENQTASALVFLRNRLGALATI